MEFAQILYKSQNSSTTFTFILFSELNSVHVGDLCFREIYTKVARKNNLISYLTVATL
jgi:hypothetical protein